jgi:hypothetical protein
MLLFASVIVQAKGNGIPSEIFKNGKVKYEKISTANLAVVTKELNLNGSWLEKPKGGFVDTEKACICFGDGMPAKRVRITPEVQK